MMSYTPGPWTAHGKAIYAKGSVDTGSGGIIGCIAVCEETSQSDGEGREWSSKGNPFENALLMAIAPELHQLAQEVALMKCETICADDLEAGCCKTCRARTLLAKIGLPTEVNTKMGDKQKSQASRAYGSSYLIFDAHGYEFETVRNRSQIEVFKIVDRIGGEAWMSGRCVMRAEDFDLLRAAKDVYAWMGQLPIPTDGCTTKMGILGRAIAKAEAERT